MALASTPTASTRKTIGETPQLLQMDLNTGQIVSKNDFHTCLATPMNDAEGVLYSIDFDKNESEPHKMEVYTLNPFLKISEKMIQPFSRRSGFFPKYWNGLLWERMISHPDQGKWQEELHAYNPDTMERVETEETPYHFIHQVDGVPYLIEKNVEFSEGGTENQTIRITNLQAGVADWKTRE